MPSVMLTEAEARRALAEATAARDGAQRTFETCTHTRAEFEPQLASKEQSLREAEQALQKLINAGSTDDAALLAATRRRDEAEVLAAAARSNMTRLQNDCELSREVLARREAKLKTAVGVVLATRADARACELDMRWRTLVADLAALYAMKSVCNQFGAATPTAVLALMKNGAFELVSSARDFGPIFQSARAEVLDECAALINPPKENDAHDRRNKGSPRYRAPSDRTVRA